MEIYQLGEGLQFADLKVNLHSANGQLNDYLCQKCAIDCIFAAQAGNWLLIGAPESDN